MTLPTRDFGFKAQGKILQLDYDFILSLEGECAVCLTNQQVQMILGIVDYFGWATRWFSNEGTGIDQEVIDALQGDLVRRLMSCCCDDDNVVVEVRFTETGVYQVRNPDTGEWEDAPEQDPRRGAPQAPPLPGEDGAAKGCASADNVAQMYKGWRDQLVTLLEAGALLTGIIAFLIGLVGGLLIISVVGSAWGVMLFGLAALLLDEGSEGVTEQITDAKIDEFKCILYCHVGADGKYTESAVAAILEDVAAQFDGLAEAFFYNTVASMGHIGLSNAGTMGSSTADDCDDCDCGEWCYFFDFAETDGDFTSVLGFWNTGCCWEGDDAPGGGKSLYATRAAVGHLTKVEAFYSFGGNGDADFYVNGSSLGSRNNVADGVQTWDVDLEMTELGFNPSSGVAYPPPNTCECLWLRLRGTGANPFGLNNCEE